MMNYNTMIEMLANKHGETWVYMLQQDTVKDELGYVKRKEERENGNAPEYVYECAIEKIDKVAERIICPANIKVGDGVTVHLYSDAKAATVIKVTACTVTVQYDTATLDPNFKPEFVIGGFAGHCTNQNEQTYTYERDPNGRVESFRWSNKYGTYGTPNNLRLTKGRHEFYDYNF